LKIKFCTKFVPTYKLDKFVMIPTNVFNENDLMILILGLTLILGWYKKNHILGIEINIKLVQGQYYFEPLPN